MCSRLALVRVASVTSGSLVTEPKSFVRFAGVGSFVPILFSLVRFSTSGSSVHLARVGQVGVSLQRRP